MSTVVFEGTIFQMRVGFVYMAIAFSSLCLFILVWASGAQKKNSTKSQAKSG